MCYNMKIDSASLKIYAVISGPCKKTQRGIGSKLIKEIKRYNKKRRKGAKRGQKDMRKIARCQI